MATNEKRNRLLRARRQDPFWVQNFETAVARIAQSEFCDGKNDQQWKADFAWLLQPDVVAKIMEGKYDNRKPKNPGLFGTPR